MSDLVIAPLVVALVGVVLVLSLARWPRVQRTTSVGVGLVYAATVATQLWFLVLGPDAPGAATYQLGGWPAPFGITLVLDGLSAFMLLIAALVGLASITFSVAFVDRANQRVYYHPLFHCLLLGVTGAFLTGDLFNLFVWFEVMLMASYVFVAFYGGAQHTASAFRYLVLNVVGSALMLLGIGGLYAITGTLNMAAMARRVAEPAAYGIDITPVVGIAALLLVVFSLKAGLFPFQFWVPDAYTAAPLPVTAMFAGVTKKVGIYAIVRLYFTVLAGATVPFDVLGITGDSPLAFVAPVLAAMGVASIFVGGLGAVSRETVEETFAYSSIGQVGFIAVAVAIAAAGTGRLQQVALVAALVYALHHSLAKSLLFLSAAAMRDATGSNRLSDIGGLAGQTPVLAGAFFIGMLSLVGLPPLAGFFGKLFVFTAAVQQFGTASPPVAAGTVLALLAGATLTIVYTTRTWAGSFWGVETKPVEGAVVDTGQLAVLATLAALIVIVGVGFETVLQFAETAASAAIDSGEYVDVVFQNGGETA